MLKRNESNEEVYRMQRRLQSVGLLSEAVLSSGRGRFGPATHKAVIQYFEGLLATLRERGEVNIEHWRALFPFPFSLPQYNGNPDFIHALEGHAGKAYWPKGKSGITLDPGCDLGYIDKNAFALIYNDVLTETQLATCLEIIGRRLRGTEAQKELKQNQILQSIRISRAEAEDLFPKIASDYWAEIKARFPILASPKCPPSVQTALLSLAYNRGPNNPALEVLKDSLSKQDWLGVADILANMQQDHIVPGIRTRRRLEAELIRKELS